MIVRSNAATFRIGNVSQRRKDLRSSLPGVLPGVRNQIRGVAE